MYDYYTLSGFSQLGATMTTDLHPALSHACPFCGAAVGRPCRTRNSGREQDWPHSRRLELTKAKYVAPTRKALCCECGNLRTYKAARRQRGYWGDPKWERALGDLKCDPCGCVTAHALVGGSDFDEVLQRVALGSWEGDWGDAERERIRRQYRAGSLPRNPYLQHGWWTRDEDEARKSGRTHIPAICGDEMELPSPQECVQTTSDNGRGFLTPAEVREQEYEDPETGLRWVDMDCVNCLRVMNLARLERQRQALRDELILLATNTNGLSAEQVTALREQIELVRGTVPPPQ